MPTTKNEVLEKATGIGAWRSNGYPSVIPREKYNGKNRRGFIKRIADKQPCTPVALRQSLGQIYFTAEFQMTMNVQRLQEAARLIQKRDNRLWYGREQRPRRGAIAVIQRPFLPNAAYWYPMKAKHPADLLLTRTYWRYHPPGCENGRKSGYRNSHGDIVGNRIFQIKTSWRNRTGYTARFISAQWIEYSSGGFCI